MWHQMMTELSARMNIVIAQVEALKYLLFISFLQYKMKEIYYRQQVQR